jgi:very-long-chain (3R)-3-hydroxyacyl-CoA dehydratase
MPVVPMQKVEVPLKIAQTLALLEVVHAAIRIVRSPVLVTATQVASRIWILWGIIDVAPGPTTSQTLTVFPTFGLLPGLHHAALSLVTLLFAWSCSEIIRYSFFALKEAGLQPYFLLWLRYSGFIVLYPLGVASELAMVWLAMPELRARHVWEISLPNAWNFGFSYWVVCYIIVALYVPGLPGLYGYMLSQRRKILCAPPRSAASTPKPASLSEDRYSSKSR